MKLTVTVSVILLLLFSCEEEVNKPAFQTLPVSELSDQGVSFNGKISLLGSENITQYGFVLATNTTPNLERDSIYSFTGTAEPGVFTKRISDGLTSGTEYFVRAFVKTSRHTHYSNSVKFKSLGSATPVIHSFNPDKGTARQEVTLVGEHFSPEAANNEVTIGTFDCSIESASQTELVVKLPYRYNTGSYPFSVTVDGKTGTSATFTLLGPVIQNISPAVGRAGTVVKISGTRFSLTKDYNIVLFDDIRAHVNSSTETELEVIVPDISEPGSKTVSVQVEPATGISPVKFNLTGPSITSISPTSGIQGTTVTITGIGFSSVPAENKVILESYFFGVMEVLSASPEQLVVKVPSVDHAGKTKILVEVKSIFVEASEEFTIEGPEITNLDPLSQYGGRTITITGKNFDPEKFNNFVTFDNKQAEIVSGNTTSLVVRVPYDVTVSGPIGLRTGNIMVTTPYNFNILTPWQKLPDFPGGVRAGAVSFTIGSISYLGMGVTGSFDHKDFWQYDHTTNVWTKKADYPGPSRAHSFSFVVNGKAYIGGGGHYGHSLITKFYDLWEYNPATNSWTQKQSFSPNNLSDIEIVATGIGSYGYFSANNFLYRYDPANDQWWIFNNSFPWSHSYRNVSMTVGSKGYFSPGVTYGGSVTFWEFDPVANTWTQMPNSPVDFGYFFVIGSKIYVGSWQYFYEFDTVAKQWTQLPVMPAYLTGTSTFSFGGFGFVATGYAGTQTDFVYRFNPNY